MKKGHSYAYTSEFQDRAMERNDWSGEALMKYVNQFLTKLRYKTRD